MKAWPVERWRRHGGQPKPAVLAAYKRRLECAGPGNRAAMKRQWERLRSVYFEHRRFMLRPSINRRWAPHWAPDYGGPTLAFNVAAALFEAAGMPGVTMAQVAQGESGLRPGSAGVDPDGTAGYGILAITSPFADAIVAKYGGYEAMWNPVKNAAAAAEIYRYQGLGAWYGTRFVTGTDLHYHGRFDLTRVLRGESFRSALRR